MAFQLPLTLPNGVMLNFHVVDSILLNYAASTTSVRLASFVAGQYAGERKNAISQSDYTFTGIPAGDPLQFVYGELKKRAEWVASVDVAEPIKAAPEPVKAVTDV